MQTAARVRWRNENRGRINELARKRYAANPEKFRQKALERYRRRPEENKAAAAAWKQRNRERVRRYARLNSVRYRYGLSFEDYEAMEQAQGSLCAICKEPATNRLLDVDHNHASGAVRELICNRCNRLLGIIEGKRELAALALEYLERHDASS